MKPVPNRQTSTKASRSLRLLTLILAVAASALLALGSGPVASASVDHQGKYRAKVAYYEALIGDEITWFDAYRAAGQSHNSTLIQLKADPASWDLIPPVQDLAQRERAMLLTDLIKEKREVLNGIDRFRDTGLDWVSGKNDRHDFKAAVGTLKSGFKEIFEATADVKDAFFYISTGDTGSAQEKLNRAGPTSITGQDLAERGVKQLRKLLK